MGTVFQFPYRTFAEISVPSLLKNLYTLRSLNQKEVIPVIKADAYGHGMVPIAKALVARGSCQMLAVATLEEATELRRKIPHGVSILVLSGFVPHQLDAYVKHRLTPMIHSIFHLKNLVGKKGLPEFHLKLDSGMNRLGIKADQLTEGIRTLEKIGVKLAGVATHFAESESALSTFADQQIKGFEAMLALLRERRLVQTDARIHIANSGGVLRHKVASSNAVRPGLGLYGISPNPRLAATDSLIPVLEWKTRILSVKEIKRGETVGYGRIYKAKKSERIAIVPIGYADGYPRLLSDLGEMLVNGKLAPVRGRVSMDLTAIDITGIPGAKEGTLVTVIGKNNKSVIDAWQVAQWAQTIPYEIFCGLSPRVPRVYLD